MLDERAATPTGELANLGDLTRADGIRAEVVDELIDRARAIGETDPRTALRLFEQARLLAEEVGHDRGRAWAILEVAGCLQDMGQYAEAMARLPQAIPLFRALGDHDGEATCRHTAGIIEIDWGNFEAAIRELTAAVDGFRLAEKRDLEAAALYNLGKVFLRLGDSATTLDYFLRCAEIEESIPEPVDLALTYGSISSICRDLGRHQSALEFAERGLAAVNPDADRRLLSTALIEVGLSLAEVGRWEEAIERLSEATAAAEASANPARSRDAETYLADLLIRRGRPIVARAHAERALAISRGLGERFAEARSLVLLWDAIAGSPPATGTGADPALLEQALAIADASGAMRLQRDAHERLARACELCDDLRGAIQHLRALVEIERRLFDDAADRRSRALTIRYEAEHARKEAEIERLRNVELAAAIADLERANAQIQEQARLLQRQATEDPLTGLANRRSLDQELARELDRSARFAHPLAVAMIDVDRFKSINDGFSHQTGDRVLQTVAHLLRNGVRDLDVVARYVGEEFALVLPETSLDEAVVIADRLRQAIASYPWSLIHPDLAVTVSIGLVPAEPGDSPASALSRADTHLYEAKRLGRNRTVSQPSPPTPLPTAGEGLGVRAGSATIPPVRIGFAMPYGGHR